MSNKFNVGDEVKLTEHVEEGVRVFALAGDVGTVLDNQMRNMSDSYHGQLEYFLVKTSTGVYWVRDWGLDKL